MPAAGLTETEVVETARFGKALAQSFADATLDGQTPVLRELAAARSIRPCLPARRMLGHGERNRCRPL